MFNQSINRAVLRIRIETKAPLLIRAGDTGLDPGGVDIKCIRTSYAGGERSVFIPGSSLKGVLRSSAEAALRGREFKNAEGACDPLNHATSCGRRFETIEASPDVHKRQCLACRLFGSLGIKGRASIRDLFPWAAEPDEQSIRANRTQIRFGVSIDRVSGGASNGKLFEQEMVVPGVSFWGDIALENYQVWQLGLLASAIEELNSGFAQLGSSKSRGFGAVEVNVESLVHEQRRGSVMRPAGVSDLVSSKLAAAYGFLPESPLPETPSQARGLHFRYQVSGAQTQEWLQAGLKALEGL